MTALIIIISLFLSLFVFWRFYFFLRNPGRQIPEGDTIITAPADGYINYIKKIENGEVPIAIKKKNKIPLDEFTAIKELKNSTGYLIGIFMTPLSVHHNRVPVSGEIIYRRHTDAPKNLSMGHMASLVFLNRPPFDEGSEFLITNERLTVGIKTKAGDVVTVTQIADAWINRIIARVDIGDAVNRGDLYGLIRFGSQLDIFVPENLVESIAVTEREYVKAGESILLKTASPV
ncbi:MAG: phosphatidylserine decarboxylase [bacterium]|nr:phosphatidylserine decarboxylase [bacterium]